MGCALGVGGLRWTSCVEGICGGTKGGDVEVVMGDGQNGQDSPILLQADGPET